MALLRPTFAPRELLRSEFAPEWCGIGAILLIDLLWAPAAQLHIGVAWHDGVIFALALLAIVALRALSLRRGFMMSEYFALTTTAATAFGVLSYLCMAHAAPLADGEFQRMDAALAFDWMRWFGWLEAHPRVSSAFRLIYDSLIYQALYFGLLLALLDRKRDLKEMFWLVFIAGLFTSAGAFLWPALGPFKQFGLESRGDFIPVMEHLRSGRDLGFPLRSMTGVVSFPSFHTTMALAYMYGFRRTGAIGVAIALLNVGMLLAIPFFGGHYLTDMIAGAAVMLASLGILKAYAAVARALRPVHSALRQGALAN